MKNAVPTPFQRRFVRRARVLFAPAVALSAALWLGPPARAEFFFPFFDNRPVRPRALIPGEGSQERRRAAHPHQAKPGQKSEHKTGRRLADHYRSGKAGELDANAKNQAEPSAALVPEGPPPPYEPQLMRLSEIMGALSYLRELCPENASQNDAKDAGTQFRDKMRALMEAEAPHPARKERLAGAFNRGFNGYAANYRACTANAQLAITRYLDEGGRIAHEISTHYRPN